MPDLTLFIDDGGVLNDNSRRGPEFQRLIAEFFPPRLGGTPEAWAEANRATFQLVFEAHKDAMAVVDAYQREVAPYETEWLTAMCDHVGVVAPKADDCAALAREAPPLHHQADPSRLPRRRRDRSHAGQCRLHAPHGFEPALLGDGVLSLGHGGSLTTSASSSAPTSSML